MSEYTEKIVNGLTGEETYRDYTEAEIAECKANEAKAKALLDSMLAAEAQKASEKAALLAKLGITEDEAKLLLS
jgi:hypothetical protein